MNNDSADNKVFFNKIAEILNSQGLKIVDQDLQKPWGGEFMIEDSQVGLFIQTLFPELKDELSASSQSKLSPKILMIKPKARFSWQYHNRREEIWKVIEGPIKITLSDNDEELDTKIYQEGDLVRISIHTRHRLIGLDDWGAVAEIWEHTNQGSPSDSSDIIRVSDDFGRK